MNFRTLDGASDTARMELESSQNQGFGHRLEGTKESGRSQKASKIMDLEIGLRVPKSWLLGYLLGTILRPDAIHKAACTRGHAGRDVKGRGVRSVFL